MEHTYARLHDKSLYSLQGCRAQRTGLIMLLLTVIWAEAKMWEGIEVCDWF